MGFKNHLILEIGKPDTHDIKAGRHPLVTRDGQRFIIAIGEYFLHAQLPGQFGNTIPGSPIPDNQAATLPTGLQGQGMQAGIQGQNALMNKFNPAVFTAGQGI